MGNEKEENLPIVEDIIAFLFMNGQFKKDALIGEIENLRPATSKQDITDEIERLINQGMIKVKVVDHIQGVIYQSFDSPKEVCSLTDEGVKEYQKIGDNLDSVDKIRMVYLVNAYQRSGGDTFSRFNLWEIGTSMRLGRKLTWTVFQYLSHEGLLEEKGIGGDIAITHQGIKFVEALEREARQQRQTQIQEISNKFLNVVYVTSGARFRVDVPILELKEKMGILDDDWSDVIDHVSQNGLFELSSKTTGYLTEKGVKKIEGSRQNLNVRSVLIVTAKPEEIRAVEEHIIISDEITTRTGHVLDYGIFDGKEGDWKVFLAEIGMGNPNAANLTSSIIRDLDETGGLDMLMFVGIAGGIKDVKEGDVVASTDVYYYESGKVAGEHLLRPLSHKVNNPVEQRARAVARRPDWIKRINETVEGVPAPRAVVGRIVSGESVMANKESEEYQRIRRAYSDAVALDMEGYGFLSAAFVYENIDAIVIRGISDMIANKDSKGEGEQKGGEADRQNIAARAASAFAFEFLSTFKLPSQRNEQ